MSSVCIENTYTWNFQPDFHRYYHLGLGYIGKEIKLIYRLFIEKTSYIRDSKW